MANRKNIEMVPVNRRKFILSNTSIPEDHGYSYQQVRDMLRLLPDGKDHDEFNDEDFTNEIGVFFEDGVGIEKDIDQAVYWYQRSADLGNDLARSNLADVLRKGTQGYPKNLKRAFELYKACGLPYAFYRVGEFYENGWAVEKDLELAKEYYRVAYHENHPLARRKLFQFDFLH